MRGDERITSRRIPEGWNPWLDRDNRRNSSHVDRSFTDQPIYHLTPEEIHAAEAMDDTKQQMEEMKLRNEKNKRRECSP